MSSDILTDLAALTTIPLTSLERLSNLVAASICHSVEESIIEGETTTLVDIGIGKLGIKLEDNIVLYKFIPSTDFEDSIKKTVLTGESPLTLKVEAALKDKITKTYKDFI